MRTELLLALVLVAGCGEEARSGGAGAGPPAQWMLDASPVVRIGAEDGAESLHRVMAGTRLRDGRIAVANAGSHQIRIFSADGRPVRDLGREGDGPGEFRAPAWIGSRGDTLVVWDVLASRISRFGSDGEFLSSTPMPEAVGTFPRMVGAYPDGSLLFASDAAASGTTEFKTGVRREHSALLRVSPAGALLGRIAQVPSTEQYASVSPDGRGFRLESLPFGRRTVMAISGNRLYVGTGEDASIRVIGLDGASRHLLSVPADRKRVGAADIDQYWKKLVTSGRSRDDEGPPPGEIPYPDALPPYAALNVDRAGRLWVGESRLPREWDQPATWWVFTPDGVLAATIRLPGRLYVLEIGEDWLLGREMDADEREAVSLYRFRPAR